MKNLFLLIFLSFSSLVSARTEGTILIYKGLDTITTVGAGNEIKSKSIYYLICEYTASGELLNATKIEYGKNKQRVLWKNQSEVTELFSSSLINGQQAYRVLNHAFSEIDSAQALLIFGKQKLNVSTGKNISGEKTTSDTATALKGESFFYTKDKLAANNYFTTTKHSLRLDTKATLQANAINSLLIQATHSNEMPELNEVIHYILNIRLFKYSEID